MYNGEDFLNNGATLKCDKGDLMSNFIILESESEHAERAAAEITDNIAGVNIKSFGECSILGKECQVEEALNGNKFIWQIPVENGDSEEESYITKNSVCLCPLGGIIKHTQISDKGSENKVVSAINTEKTENKRTPFEIKVENIVRNDIDMDKIKKQDNFGRVETAVDYLSEILIMAEITYGVSIAEDLRNGMYTKIKNVSTANSFSATNYKRMNKINEIKNILKQRNRIYTYKTNLKLENIIAENAFVIGGQIQGVVFEILGIEDNKIEF